MVDQKEIEMPSLFARQVEHLKSQGRYYEAGYAAFKRDPNNCTYGPHYGLRSDHEYALLQFYAGFDAAKKNQK